MIVDRLGLEAVVPRPVCANFGSRPLRSVKRIAAAGLLAAVSSCQLFKSADADSPDTDGRIKWSLPDYFGFGQPALWSGRAFFTTIDHRVVSVNMANGRVEWTADLPVEPPHVFGQGSVIAGSTLVAGDKDVFGLDPMTGEIRWRFTPSVGRNPGLFLPAASDSLVILGSSSGHVYSVRAATGDLQWQAKVGRGDTVSVFRPSVDGDRVLVGFTEFNVEGPGTVSGGVACLSLQTGAVRWMRSLPGYRGQRGLTGTIEPAVLNGVVIAGARDGPVYAYSVADGELLWTLPPILGSNGNPAMVQDIRPLSATRDVFIVGTTARELFAVNPVDGAVRWRFAQGYGSSVWVRGTSDEVYITYGYGQLEVVDAASGRLKWSTEEPKGRFSPAIDDTLVVISGSGFHALRRR